MLTDTRKSVNAKVHPVDGLNVEWTGGPVSYTHLTLPTTPYV